MYIKTIQLVFYLTIFSTPCIDHLLYLIFRCDFDVTESLGTVDKLNTALMSLYTFGMRERGRRAVSLIISI